jgi:hypothetical protein
MNNRRDLNLYIARLQQRLRLGVWLRGTAIFTCTALTMTVALVLLLNRLAFPMHGVTAARLAIFVALAFVAVFGIALPVIGVTRNWAAHKAEAASPGLQQRLTTFAERAPESCDPFLELLAADTLSHTMGLDARSLVPGNRLFVLGGMGAACLGVLVWIIVAGSGYLGYGAAKLWTNRNASPLYMIAVTPGNATVRRNSDQLITSHVTAMHPDKAQLFAHFESSSGWEPVTMQEARDAGSGATYQFVFTGVPESVEYYVAAGPLVSSHYKLRVRDLPSVKQISVTYRYPAWTGMKPIEEHSGDLRAIEGTEAAIEVEMDRPLKDGHMVLDNGQTIHLAPGGGNKYQGSIHLDKDGAYHMADTDAGQEVRVSEDYFIAADKGTAPEIAIERPGGDYRASPIEEVTLGVTARDKFGINDLHLHYSVNGGPGREVNLLKTLGTNGTNSSYTLPLEDYKLVPGDLVSYYATARNGHSETRTDIRFIQVEPFEREFSQSQQGGGGEGGGGSANNQMEISRREKELIAATWKQQNDRAASPNDARAAAQFLSDAQQKLREQVTALSVRMQSRDLSHANEEFSDFHKDMQDAAAAMAPSAEKLKGMQWKDAMQWEQKALQALLRAEATFRKIEVAFGQRGGPGGGAGSSGRDLASLFELELDMEKNQYETAQKKSAAEQHEKDVEDALAKLDELNKRQEELTSQQRNPQQNFEQRWQQEMLRREAEQLQREIERMVRDGQQAANGPPQNSQEQSREQAGNLSSDRFEDQRADKVLQHLRQATEAMKSVAGLQRGGASAAAQQAAEELRQASGLLAGTQQQLASTKVDSLAREASRLTQEEHLQANQINRFADRQRDSSSTDLENMMARVQERNRLAQERQLFSNDLSKLQKNIRDASRELARTQPGAAQKLRNALTEMDESDLDNHVQRTADWLRRGIDPNANGTESRVAQGLEKLNQQLQEAQEAVGQDKSGQPGSNQRDETAALERVEQLRNQLESMAASRTLNGGPGANWQQGKNAPGNAQDGEQARTQRNNDSGDQSGDTPYGGVAADGTVWGNINTGNNRYGHAGERPAPAGPSNNYNDTERTFQQGMRNLNRLGDMVRNDPQAAKEVAELARQMQRLDPNRFSGNPAMVERMQRELLGSVDKLELLLRYKVAGNDARTSKSDAVPPEYQESVADYFRRLSKNP